VNGGTAGAAGAGGARGQLADSEVKLIAYFIVSLRPGRERLMPKGADTMVMTDNMSDETFAGYVVARYFQSGAYTELSAEEQAEANADRKYLRVHFNVVRRWPREPRRYDERQIAVLEDIGRALAASSTVPRIGGSDV
jgi:hypothetical protein